MRLIAFFVFLSLILWKVNSVTPQLTTNDPLNENQYKNDGEPEVIQNCTACNFNQMKSIEECMISGSITTIKTVKVNVNDPTDRVEQYRYNTCEREGLGKYGVYIFILIIAVSLKVSLSKLIKYRNDLETKMYQKLSINKV